MKHHNGDSISVRKCTFAVRATCGSFHRLSQPLGLRARNSGWVELAIPYLRRRCDESVYQRHQSAHGHLVLVAANGRRDSFLPDSRSCFTWPTVSTPNRLRFPGAWLPEDGSTLFTGDDIMAGQHVFQKYGLMQYGTIFGHGAYLGPDFTAQYLREAAGMMIDFHRGRGLAETDARQRTSGELKQNRFDPQADLLR